MGPRPLRVLRIIDRLNVGGPAKHVVWLTAGLDPSAFETLLVTGRVAEGEGDMGWFASRAGVTPHVLPEMSRELSLADAGVIVRLLRVLREFRPDVVHTHKSKAGAAGRVAALLYRWSTLSALLGRPRPCRVVHTFHGHTFHGYFGPWKERLFLALERALARFATDRIVVISAQQRHEIGERFGVGRAEQFRVIPLGIDVGEVAAGAASLRAELGVGPDDHLVGIVGRLCAIKNHSLFLRAVRCVAESHPDLARRTRFVVVGDGELRSDLEAEAGRLGITDLLVFTGFRDDAARLYGSFDLVVLTSRNEGTPVTLIEALCAGRAVLSTEVGGVVDLLGSCRTPHERTRRWDHGWTVASDDAEALAEAMAALLAAPDVRREMGERGRAFVRERLSKERLVADVAALYRELVDAASLAAVSSAGEPAPSAVLPRSSKTSSRP